jgi:hypothetical protein
MNKIASTRPTSTTVAVAMSAAILTGQLQYPHRVEPYQVHQVRGSYSDFMQNLARPVGMDNFAQQMAAIYGSFAQRQERLGVEFEAAIFSDLESLYEA